MDKYEEFIEKCEDKIKDLYKRLEEISTINTERVLKAFQNNKVALRHFNSTTGYGYGDDGRDTLNKIYAEVFSTESAVVSPHIACGTHAISLGLYALLRPNDLIVSVTGNPYDTLMDTIFAENKGSLRDYGIKFQAVELKDNKIDIDEVLITIKSQKVKMLYMQRSRGYAWRDSLSISEIESFCKTVRSNGFDGIIYMDNCYGEFVDDKEPTAVGVDVCAGSLIKNIGGGIAPTGGYLAGKTEYIDQVLYRLNSPSLGGEVGSYDLGYRLFYQGLFNAPHIVKEALKTSLLFGSIMSELGYETLPNAYEMPNDITRSIKFNDEKKLINFIQAIQKVSPVDSYVTLEPWDMPGYDSKVIMAAGCFIQGSSIELSADAPIKEPYICYIQGGTTYEHGKIAVKYVLENLKLLYYFDKIKRQA